MIIYTNPGKIDVRPSAIKMTDSSSLPKKKDVLQNETTTMTEKGQKLPIFYQHRIKGKKFELF